MNMMREDSVWRRGCATVSDKQAGSGVRNLKQRVKTAQQALPLLDQKWLERQLNDPYVARAKREG